MTRNLYLRKTVVIVICMYTSSVFQFFSQFQVTGYSSMVQSDDFKELGCLSEHSLGNQFSRQMKSLLTYLQHFDKFFHYFPRQIKVSLFLAF